MELRKLQKGDLNGMYEWIHDPEINQYFRIDFKTMTKKDALEFIIKSHELFKKGTDYHFAVTDSEDNYMGTISIKNIDTISHTGEYAISLRKCAQGTGIAFSATSSILSFAFQTLHLNRVYLNVLSDNTRALNFYKKYGFIYEGEFREHLCLNGHLRSLQWYSLLKCEYLQLSTRVNNKSQNVL